MGEHVWAKLKQFSLPFVLGSFSLLLKVFSTWSRGSCNLRAEFWIERILFSCSGNKRSFWNPMKNSSSTEEKKAFIPFIKDGWKNLRSPHSSNAPVIPPAALSLERWYDCNLHMKTDLQEYILVDNLTFSWAFWIYLVGCCLLPQIVPPQERGTWHGLNANGIRIHFVWTCSNFSEDALFFFNG